MKYILVFFLFFLSAILSAEEHLIDIQLSKCIENRFETETLKGDCYSNAYEAWDIKLNKVYKKLKKTEFKKLKEVQIKWVKFKEAELIYWSAFYNREDNPDFNMIELIQILHICNTV